MQLNMNEKLVKLNIELNELIIEIFDLQKNISIAIKQKEYITTNTFDLMYQEIINANCNINNAVSKFSE